ncbi:MAG: LysM peptidoglycan-binding domain-containing protein [Planctomycetia bacterium]|nr:LysM peptidoglycan-binding domain-containing protein [Planctomycetia bacterium]
MEMLRTFIIALFFAAITVCSYYFLNEYPMPWEQTAETTSAEEKKATEPAAPAMEPPVVAPLEASPFAATPHPETPQTPETTDASLPGLDSFSPNTETTTALPVPESSDLATNPFDAAPTAAEATADTQVGRLPDLPTPSDEVAGTIPTNPLRSGSDEVSPLPRAVTDPAPVVPAVAPAIPESAPETVADTAGDQAVRDYLASAKDKIQQGQVLEVLRSLSPYYGDPRFSKEESEYLVSILVQAATQVIYSQKHILEPAYVVQPGDTLPGIAEKYNIPAEFIARVNGIAAPYTLEPGRELKVLRGPFNAIVYLDRYEMILTLNGLFAGQFWIGVGNDLAVRDGDFHFRQMLRSGNPQASEQFAFEFVRNLSQTVPGTPLPDSLLLHPATDPTAIGKSVPQGNILLSTQDIGAVVALLGKDSKLQLRSHSPHSPAAGMAATPAPNVGTPNPVASPLNESIGQQASLPGYDASPATAPAEENPFDDLSAEGLPADGLPAAAPAASATPTPPDVSPSLGGDGSLPTELPTY